VKLPGVLLQSNKSLKMKDPGELMIFLEFLRKSQNKINTDMFTASILTLTNNVSELN